MEVNQLIEKLLESGITENKELGINLLRSADIPLKEKKRFIESFLKEFTEGSVDFSSTEEKDIFREWVELYLTVVDDLNEQNIKNGKESRS